MTGRSADFCCEPGGGGDGTDRSVPPSVRKEAGAMIRHLILGPKRRILCLPSRGGALLTFGIITNRRGTRSSRRPRSARSGSRPRREHRNAAQHCPDRVRTSRDTLQGPSSAVDTTRKGHSTRHGRTARRSDSAHPAAGRQHVSTAPARVSATGRPRRGLGPADGRLHDRCRPPTCSDRPAAPRRRPPGRSTCRTTMIPGMSDRASQLRQQICRC